MATKYIDIPLINYPIFDLSVSLEGNSYIVEFIYNSRMKLYTISLYDAARNPIVVGEALVPEYPIFFDYALSDLTGYFFLTKKEEIQSQPYKEYPEAINQFYDLVYVYRTED